MSPTMSTIVAVPDWRVEMSMRPAPRGDREFCQRFPSDAINFKLYAPGGAADVGKARRRPKWERCWLPRMREPETLLELGRSKVRARTKRTSGWRRSGTATAC